MEISSNIRAMREAAAIVRCSKEHVANVMSGNVASIERLTRLSVGRRKLIRRDWLEHWMENNRIR